MGINNRSQSGSNREMNRALQFGYPSLKKQYGEWLVWKWAIYTKEKLFRRKIAPPLPGASPTSFSFGVYDLIRSLLSFQSLRPNTFMSHAFLVLQDCVTCDKNPPHLLGWMNSQMRAVPASMNYDGVRHFLAGIAKKDEIYS